MTTIGLSNDRADLQRTVADYLKMHAAHAETGGAEADGYSRDAWLRAASIGLPGMVISDNWGGLSLGWVEAAIVAFEGGRVNWQSPYLFTTLASAALEEAGQPDLQRTWLPKIREGRVTCAIAVLDEPGPHDPQQLTTSAERSSGDWVLNSEKLVVADGFQSDLLVVLCRTSDGIDGQTAFCVPATQSGVHREVLGSLDLGRPHALVTLDNVRIDDGSRLGPLGGGACLAAWLIPRVAVGVAAESVGIAAGALEIATRYAKERQQFGRPIGYFQGVSHRLADAYRRVENATSLVLRAAESLDDQDANAHRLASMARVLASRVARDVVGTALQVHGGYGYTWENRLHTYWRRATSNAYLPCTAEWHLEQLIADKPLIDLDEWEGTSGGG
jgi:alkylation response protein AidB-like acyl-CoA dehydrogenase